MATIKDIAQKLGVSESTVSRALKRDPRISTATRERVFEAARSLHYIAYGTPPVLYKKVIGIIVPELSSSNYTMMVNAVSDLLKRRGYSVMVAVSNLNRDEEGLLLDRFAAVGVSAIGLIPTAPARGLLPLLDDFKTRTGIPVVVLGGDKAFVDYDTVTIDIEPAVREMVSYLIDLGHREVGILSERHTEGRERLVERVLKQQGIAVCKIVSDKRFEKAGVDCVETLLRRGSLPTALVATYDYIAIGAIRALSERGIRVPAAVSVVGIDDIPSSAYLPLALSTISMPHELHGGIAARLLIDRTENGQPTAVEHIRGEAVFSPRETTASLQSHKPLDLS